MKVIQNRVLPFGRRYYAINLFGVTFAKGPVDDLTVNHELIHTAQMKEMLYVFFYIWYGMEWFVRLLQTGNSFRAYHSISFEREAYAHGDDLGYLKRRRHFAWRRYFAKSSKIF